MADGLNRILGDSPGRTIIKLVIISVVVGFVMNMLGFSPWDIVRFLQRSVNRLWNSGFAALGEVGNYLVIGAMVVIPIFIILRILNWRKS